MTTMNTFQLKGLGSRGLSALRRRAKQLGMSPEHYLEQLVEVDLALGEKAMASSWEELTKPFREALGEMTEEQIDAWVDKARGPKRKRSGQ